MNNLARKYDDSDLDDEALKRIGEDKLDRWSSWVRQYIGEKIGYGNETTIAKIMREGIDGAVIRSGDTGIYTQDELETDQIIAKMPKRYKKVLKLAYISFKSPVTCAQIMRVDIHGYWKLLGIAKADFMGRL